MNQQNPYKVPQGYLEELEKKILTRSQNVEQTPSEIEPFDLESESQQISWGRAWKQMIGFAAAFALLVGIGWLFVYIASDGTPKVAQKTYETAVIDTAHILWVLEEPQVIEIIEQRQNNNFILAQAAAQYLSFYGEADDVNLIYYD